MLFNSFEFLFGFLPLALLLYFGLARLSLSQLANVSLVVMSLVFYGWWAYTPANGSGEARRMLSYVGVLCASTTGNFFLGRSLQLHPRRGLLALGVAANLALLAWFKYSAFGARTINALFGPHLPVPEIVLPLAISFYTFTQIAFIVDAYWGRAAEMSFSRYALFVSFFPHLIAGPIVHHAEIMPQFARPEAKRWHFGNVAAGLCWLTLGLFKKVGIADACAPLANSVFAHTSEVTILEGWGGTLAYAMQLYFDFSGYSDMAIGLSLLFNVRLPDNFAAPYRAENIIEFWRRWHITLSRFLRDYVYIPLGGNRRGPVRRYANLLLTMLLGGIWHGAGWTFLVWGAYHGALLTLCHLWRNRGWRFPAWSARLLTFLAVLLGWVIFRAADLSQAVELLASMTRFSSFRLEHLASALQLEQLAGLVGLVLFVNLAPTTKEWVESRELNAGHALLLALLFCISLFLIRNLELNYSKSEFIYFQF